MKAWRQIVALILLLTAIAKLFSLIHPVALLSQTDPVFKVRIFYVVAVAGVLELLLSILVAFLAKENVAAWLIFAFGGIVLTYRTIASIGGSGSCPCLGNATQWWPWLGEHENALLTSLALWLSLTASFQLAWKSPR